MSTAGHADIFAPPAAAADGRIELIGLDRAELEAELARVGEPPFRARQLWHWIYHRGATDFAAMTTLAKSFRADLAERYVVCAARAPWSTGSRSTAPANGCCASPTGRRSRPSTSRRRIAARSASPPRSAAR